MTSLPPPIAHLQPLLGTWRGEGHGEYPTIASFDYVDEWEFVAPPGKPFIRFIERTWDADGQPKHTETGYLRCPSPELIEIIAAIPTGQAENGSGSVTVDDGLTIATDAIVLNTESAKRVDRIVRRFEVNGDELTYGMEMAAVDQPLTLHLRATLRRVTD
ncbi:FABP family protein [Ammonicoccus fulvus]|uniref:FABP family protein n=1 Tax=Ammonicoccus fulvus TaxID=3138240 RepID=A0ABZ3FIJ7_9ACTN